MYPTKGSNPYGQQTYSAQQGYGQHPGAAYSGNPVGQNSMPGATQEVSLSGYRGYASQAAPQYGGPYAAVYGSSSVPTAQQGGVTGNKGAASSGLQGRTGYASALAEPSKLSSGAMGSSLGMKHDDYVSAATLGYGQKGDQFSAVKTSDYPSMDHRHYAEHQTAYIGRDLQSDAARRYADSVSFSHQHKSEMQDHMDQASLLRQQQMLKAQPLQSGLDIRQSDYLAARAAPAHHGLQEYSSYGGRMDADPRNLSVLGGTSYGGQHPASVLGGAPRRNVDDLMYAQGPSGVGYGVGLPPGRDYAAGKGSHGPSHESDYQASILSRGHPSLGIPMIDERKDDRSGLRRELEIRDDERRREIIREREKERERERDRQRERSRLLKHREKEREHDRKRVADSKRERTPPRTTRDRRASSSVKDERYPRRVSPRRETLQRHRSPVKEKRREYLCKVYPYSFVDVERDYLSISKRYPKLSISSDFSKVVVNWPKQNLNLSLDTPVSFEHDILEVDSKPVEKGSVPLVVEASKSNYGSTVWNAKVILMSGVGSDALNELCSERSSNDKTIHLNNLLKFAVLRKDHSFMAIGGPWNGGDPSSDSSLIQTALRHVKDLTQLDLHNCRHWNRFLEIHYNRVGKDGLFSHKEVTVLFVPDLSDCLPSVDLWRSQWLAQKKEIAGRERQPSSKQEKKTSEKKDTIEGDESLKGTEKDDVKDEKESAILEGKSDGKHDEQNTDDISELRKNVAEQKAKESISDGGQISKEEEGMAAGEDTTGEENVENETSIDPEVEVQKPAKKKVVRKVVKGKVVGKKGSVAAKSEKLDVEDVGEKQVKQETVVQEGENPAEPSNVKTFVRKRIIRKVPVGKSTTSEVNGKDSPVMQAENTTGKEPEQQEDKTKGKEKSEGVPVQETVVKTTGKKKVIKRVIRKKVTRSEDKDIGAANMKAEVEVDNMRGQDVTKDMTKVEDMEQDEKKNEGSVQVSKSENRMTEELKTLTVEKQGTNGEDGKEDQKDSIQDDRNSKKEKEGSKSTTESSVAKVKDTKKNGQDDNDRDKDESKDAKHESKDKADKEVKGKVKSEEQPEKPGLFLQTKQSKESKVRSISLSLDGLLDYNEKDIQESSFELSLFAESFYEMLQYQMGCRILSFLEKVRRRFIIKHNQRKRQRDENSEKGNEKRARVDGIYPEKVESPKSEKQAASNIDGSGKMNVATEAGVHEPTVENKFDGNDMDEEEEEEEEEEDPEEIIEDDEEMNDASTSNIGVQEQDVSAYEKADLKTMPEEATTGDKMSKDNVDGKMDDKTLKTDKKSEREKEDKHAEKEKLPSTKNEVVDKELLQAFRFFDYNHVGFIRVEDLRCIIHNLGKFLPHRDVKELVQVALLETNSPRDNRIFYKKLARLTDI